MIEKSDSVEKSPCQLKAFDFQLEEVGIVVEKLNKYST